jgi:folate-binding protein YgfZ
MSMPFAASTAALDLGFLAVSGRDAESFLNGQLSRRVPAAGATPEAPLAAWHDPQGRVRCLCRVLWSGTAYVLMLERRGLSSLAAQLPRYALRAELRFEPLLDWCAIAVIGTTLPPEASCGGAAAAIPIFTVPVGPSLRYVAGPRAAAATALASLPAVDPEKVVGAEIRLGLPELGFWSEPKFVGQMLNLDRLGAIAFDKGCFPGQEVLTRVHRLGNVKRRLYRYRGQGTALPPVGSALLATGQRAIGEVLRVARDDGGFELLGLVPNEARDQALRCEATAVELERLPLPTDAPE